MRDYECDILESSGIVSVSLEYRNVLEDSTSLLITRGRTTVAIRMRTQVHMIVDLYTMYVMCED